MWSVTPFGHKQRNGGQLLTFVPRGCLKYSLRGYAVGYGLGSIDSNHAADRYPRILTRVGIASVSQGVERRRRSLSRLTVLRLQQSAPKISGQSVRPADRLGAGRGVASDA
jgi:hypothetical protein